MGRIARANFKPDELKKYLKKHPQINAQVYYSPLLDTVRMCINGKPIGFINERGNLYYRTGQKLTKTFIYLGELCHKKPLNMQR